PIQVPVEEFTTPDPVTADASTMVDDLRLLMERHGIRHLPIVQDGAVVGIVSDRDMRLFAGLSASEKFQVQASDIMAENPLSEIASTPQNGFAFLTSDRSVGRVIVKDEETALLGIFTATDALKTLIEFSPEGRASAS